MNILYNDICKRSKHFIVNDFFWIWKKTKCLIDHEVLTALAYVVMLALASLVKPGLVDLITRYVIFYRKSNSHVHGFRRNCV